MHRIIVVALAAAALAGCDAINMFKEGMAHAKAVETDIAASTGVKPRVGFDWKNGQLVSVAVNFPGLYEDKPLRELAALVNTAVLKEFKQTPGTVVLSFALDPQKTPGVAAARSAN